MPARKEPLKVDEGTMPHLASPLEGRWWLPSQARRSRRGVLRNASEGGFELKIDSAWNFEVMHGIDAKNHIVLFGRSDDGRAITLVRGFLLKWGVFDGSSVTFHFDQAVLGAHFSDMNEAALAELRVRIPSLDRWLGISGLRVDYDPRSRNEIAIHFVQPEDVKFELEPGLNLIFSFGWKGPALAHPQLKASLHQEVWLLIRASPARRFTELWRIASRMLDLFTLLVGEPLAFEAAFAQSPINRKEECQDVEILFSPVGEDVTRTVGNYGMLLNFGDVQARLPRLFSRWLEEFEILQSAFNVYFSMLRRNLGYQEERFLGLIRALEVLHRLKNKDQPSERHKERITRILTPLDKKDRKWLEGRLKHSHERGLPERMGDLLSPFGDLFGAPDQIKSFVERVVDTRNYLTHYSPNLRDRAVEPSRLLPYQYRLRVLFILHCLLSLEFSPLDARLTVEKNTKLSQMVRFGEL